MGELSSDPKALARFAANARPAVEGKTRHLWVDQNGRVRRFGDDMVKLLEANGAKTEDG
jgi:hypothetical protein